MKKLAFTVRPVTKPSQRIRQRQARAAILGSEAAMQLSARINTLKDLSRHAQDIGRDIVAIVREVGVDNVSIIERLQGERGVLLAALSDCHNLIRTSLDEGTFSDTDSEDEIETLARQVEILITSAKAGRYLDRGALGAILNEADRHYRNTRTRF